MRLFSPALKYCRLCAFILLGLLALSLAACDGNRAASSRPAASSTAPDDNTGPVLADISAAYDACLDRCNEQTSLGSLTREGCFTGCAEIRRQTDVRDKVYPSRQACFDDMRTVDLNRDLIIERYQAWCLQQWNHLHKRRGCLDAINVFYTHITADAVCGPNAASLDRAYASGVSVSPLPSPPAASPAPLPPQPMPTPPLSSGTTSAQMPPAAQSAPVLAAPVVPEPVVAAPVAPTVQDTPKYQSTSAKKTAKKKAKAPAKTKTVKPEPKAVEKDTPMPELSEPKVAPAPQPVTPEASVPQSPKSSVPLAAPTQPAVAPAPAPVTSSAQPAPSATPKPPVAPAQTAPAPPAVSPAPMPAAQPQAPAAPAPQVPVSGAPAAQPTPQAVAPAAKAPTMSNSTAPQPAPEAQSPPPTLVPVPSMLERAYTSPAVLAPQSQGGQGSAAPLVPPLPPVNQTPPAAP